MIKFRFWSKEEKEYVDLGYWEEFSIDEIQFDEDETMKISDSQRFIPEQWIGIKDKNGIDIFVGDILFEPRGEYTKERWTNENEPKYSGWELKVTICPPQKPYVAVFEEGQFKLKSMLKYPFNESKIWNHISSDCTIVSNIHKKEKNNVLS